MDLSNFQDIFNVVSELDLPIVSTATTYEKDEEDASSIHSVTAVSTTTETSAGSTADAGDPATLDDDDLGAFLWDALVANDDVVS